MLKNLRFAGIGILLAFLIKPLLADARNLEHDRIKIHSAKIFNELVDLRRDIHRHPEVAGEEKRTAKLVEDYLKKLGMEVKTNIGGYGVVGILKGAKEGKSIIWRADMDAIYSDAADSVDFKSLNSGVRHICGHDVHTVVSLGIANTLSQYADDLAGTIYFVFQPAEETMTGAKAMISDGLFDFINADEVYGLHLAPMETGIISTKPGLVYSHSRRLKLEFKGTDDSGQLSQMVNSIISNLSYTKANATPWDLKNLMDLSVGIGNPDTIYRDYLIINEKLKKKQSENGITFEAGFVTSDTSNLKGVLTTIRKEFESTAYAKRLMSVSYIVEHPAVKNNTELANQALMTISDVYGARAVQKTYGIIPFFNDDFALFQERVPGVYFFLGGSNRAKGIRAMPHTPDFEVDERSIKIGVNYFSSLLLERAKK